MRLRSRTRVALLTVLAMMAFAGNSLLCRAALKSGGIDAASFTSVRLLAGALALWLMVHCIERRAATKVAAGPGALGNWPSALALFAYAACFSFAYVELAAATGALLLFGSVQASMIGYGLFKGERFRGRQWLGFICALGGLIGLLLPGLAAPPLPSALLMIAAGIAWGIYSLRGRMRGTGAGGPGAGGPGAGGATAVTAGNFMRAVPFAIVLSLGTSASASMEMAGVMYALVSGALASGLGYAVWYTALPGLRATTAATVQLSVPLITALGGILLLGESFTLRLALAAAAILGGIALVVTGRSASAGRGHAK